MAEAMFQRPEEFDGMLETGTLPVGIVYEGKLHRDFALRPATAGDLLAVEQHPLAKGGPRHVQMILLARQLEELGSIPKQKFSFELIHALAFQDWQHILEADARLDGRVSSFRGEDQSAPEVHSPAGGEDGVVGS